MRRRLGGLLVLTAVGMALCLSTAARARVWSDEQALWAEATRKSPNKPRPWINLGAQQELRGDVLSAEVSYREAIRVTEEEGRRGRENRYGYALAQANLARLEAARGDLKGAIGRLRAVTPYYPVKAVVELQTWFERQLATQ